IINLSKTSRAVYSLVTWYKRTTWDPTTIYKKWFIHVSAFRRLLRRTNAIISGSFALQFFDRSIYPGSDMDIFLRAAGASDVCYWLLSQGY
ncbi:hypothetical protein CPB84DRAFT_1629013, partial [Gymnopilus junonius]